MSSLARYESELVDFFLSKHASVLTSLKEVGKLDDDIVAGLEAGITEFTEGFQA